jgi:hypothetical protein
VDQQAIFAREFARFGGFKSIINAGFPDGTCKDLSEGANNARSTTGNVLVSYVVILVRFSCSLNG